MNFRLIILSLISDLNGVHFPPNCRFFPNDPSTAEQSEMAAGASEILNKVYTS